jgi:RNA polymerase sigma factor for flagellar operon FliA
VLKKKNLFDRAYLVKSNELGRHPDRNEVEDELAKDCYVYNKRIKIKGAKKAEKIFRDVGMMPSFYSIDNLIGGNFSSDGKTFHEHLAAEKVEHNSGLGFEEILEGVSERDKSVLRLYYVEKNTQKKIGEILGVSEGRVSQIRTRAKRKIKWGFDERGWSFEDALGIFCD